MRIMMRLHCRSSNTAIIALSLSHHRYRNIVATLSLSYCRLCTIVAPLLSLCWLSDARVSLSVFYWCHNDWKRNWKKEKKKVRDTGTWLSEGKWASPLVSQSVHHVFLLSHTRNWTCAYFRFDLFFSSLTWICHSDSISCRLIKRLVNRLESLSVCPTVRNIVSL